MKAYYNEWLMLPKSRFNLPSLINALTFPIRSRDAITGYIKGYKVDDRYFYAPREFYSDRKLSKLGLKVEYQLPDSYEHVDFDDSIVLDAQDPSRDIQRRAFAELTNHGNGVLSLACGRGKTVVAMKYVSLLQRPTLVIVETTTLVNQWAEEFQKKLKLKDNEIGIIQGSPEKWVVDTPVVMATIQSLARYADTVPRDIQDRFGLVVFDEVHHLSAPYYNKTAALFPGLRLGLSATPDRLDGLEGLYFAHIGPVFFQDLSQDLVPMVDFHKIDLSVDWNKREVIDQIVDRTGELSWTRLWGFLGDNKKFLDSATDLICGCAKSGRKSLVLSARINTVKRVNEELNKRMPGVSDTITSRTKQDCRLDILRNKQVTVGITRIAREGLDEPSLDTIIILEPFSDPYTLQQTVGRALRICSTKKAPQVHILAANFDPCIRMMFSMYHNFRKWSPQPEMVIHQ